MANADEIRDAQRATWASLSTGWGKWELAIMDQLRPVGAAMIERLEVTPDHVHLDIASGTGEPGLSIAPLVPNGRVVLTDLVAEMLDIAARRAVTTGITNVDTRVCSADDLPFDDNTFDSVTVRFGYMFFPDLIRATAEFVRVLKPGGRVCASVWVQPDQNPWTGIALSAIATEATLPHPDPDAPGMFRCAAPGCISALYAGAELIDVDEWAVPVALTASSPDEYWDIVSEHVSPAVTALAQVDDAARDRIRSLAIANVEAFVGNGGVRVPGLARCIIGTRPTHRRAGRR